MKPTTPKDIFRIACTNPTVKALLTYWEAGEITWEQAMTHAVALLDYQNGKLMETAKLDLQRAPFPAPARPAGDATE